MSTADGVVRRVEQVMGMPISLAVRGPEANSAAVEAAWRQAISVLRDADATFSTYREDSWVSRLDAGLVDIADCPPEVHEVLELGEQARIASGGAFAVWQRDAEGRMRLDPSGVVKGWGVQRAMACFDHLDNLDVCLSAGGDMACVTRVPGSPGWKIGIENPDDTSEIMAVVPIVNGAIATSGLAHRGAHIVNPATGQPVEGYSSVTVIGDDLTWVDIDATAACAMGEAGVAWLRGRGRSGVVVHAGGRRQVFGAAA